MGSSPPPCFTGIADSGHVSLACAFAKAPSTGELPWLTGVTQRNRRAGSRCPVRGAVRASGVTRTPPAVAGIPGDLGVTPARSPYLLSTTDQRSSAASGSRIDFTRTEVCTPSRMMKQRVQVAVACANPATAVTPTEVSVASGIAERTHPATDTAHTLPACLLAGGEPRTCVPEVGTCVPEVGTCRGPPRREDAHLRPTPAAPASGSGRRWAQAGARASGRPSARHGPARAGRPVQDAMAGRLADAASARRTGATYPADRSTPRMA